MREIIPALLTVLEKYVMSCGSVREEARSVMGSAHPRTCFSKMLVVTGVVDD